MDQKSGLVRCAALGILIAVSVGGLEASFRETPPTIGVYRATAYMLRGGDLQIHLGVDLPVTAPSSRETRGGVAVGIGGFLQFGIGLSYGRQARPAPAYMGYSASAKLGFTLGTAVSLAVPFAVSFWDGGMGTEFQYVQAGGVLSVRVAPVTAHGGAGVGLQKTGSFIRPYVIVDLDLFPNLKVVGEVAFSPLSVAAGAWLRFLDFLDLKIALTPVPLAVSVTLYLRV